MISRIKHNMNLLAILVIIALLSACGQKNDASNIGITPIPNKKEIESRDDDEGSYCPQIKYNGKIYWAYGGWQKDFGETYDCSKLNTIGKIESCTDVFRWLTEEDPDYTTNMSELVGSTLYEKENGDIVVITPWGGDFYEVR